MMQSQIAVTLQPVPTGTAAVSIAPTAAGNSPVLTSLPGARSLRAASYRSLAHYRINKGRRSSHASHFPLCRTHSAGGGNLTVWLINVTRTIQTTFRQTSSDTALECGKCSLPTDGGTAQCYPGAPGYHTGTVGAGRPHVHVCGFMLAYFDR